MTTTSPRAINLPLTLNSTGASAAFSNWTTEPTDNCSTSRMGSWQLPSSMVRLTGTSKTRLRLGAVSAVAFIVGSLGDRLGQLDRPFAGASAGFPQKLGNTAK